MLERVLSLAVITGFVGALQAPAWRGLPAERLPCALLGDDFATTGGGSGERRRAAGSNSLAHHSTGRALVGTVGMGWRAFTWARPRPCCCPRR